MPSAGRADTVKLRWLKANYLVMRPRVRVSPKCQWRCQWTGPYRCNKCQNSEKEWERLVRRRSRVESHSGGHSTPSSSRLFKWQELWKQHKRQEVAKSAMLHREELIRSNSRWPPQPRPSTLECLVLIAWESLPRKQLSDIFQSARIPSIDRSHRLSSVSPANLALRNLPGSDILVDFKLTDMT